ncbi:MAG: hypothetical protein PHS62_01215 [Patescibacteria group bacterium]|nr:hypothetical protein [Patescibacteria group bacterium]
MINQIIKKYRVRRERLDETTARLVKDLWPHVIDGTIINGGNFQIRDGIYRTHYLATASFKAAVLLFKRAKSKNKKATLSFLIDNFSIRDKVFKIPKEYLKILKENHISLKAVFYFKESQLRNRAGRHLVKRISGGKLKAKNLFYEVAHFFRKIEIARKHKTLKVFTPLGTALLTQQLFDSEKLGNKVAMNLMHEGSYVSKNNANALVYHSLGGKMTVINVYFKERADHIIIEASLHK